MVRDPGGKGCLFEPGTRCNRSCYNKLMAKLVFPEQRADEEVLFVFRRHIIAMRKGFYGFLLPLALGTQSLCEILDCRLTREVDFHLIEKELRGALPPGFELIRAAKPVQPAGAVAWAEYDILLEYPEDKRDEMSGLLGQIFEREEIKVTKKTKKGVQVIDLKPYAALLGSSRAEGGLCISVRLASGSGMSIAPKLLLDAFFGAAPPPDHIRITRTRVLDAELSDFS